MTVNLVGTTSFVLRAAWGSTRNVSLETLENDSSGKYTFFPKKFPLFSREFPLFPKQFFPPNTSVFFQTLLFFSKHLRFPQFFCPDCLFRIGTGAKQCIHYEILEQCRGIIGRASLLYWGKIRSVWEKVGNFWEKVILSRSSSNSKTAAKQQHSSIAA